MSRFFKSAAFPILIVIVLAFFASKLISRSDEAPATSFSTLPHAARRRRRQGRDDADEGQLDRGPAQPGGEEQVHGRLPVDYAEVLVNKLRPAQATGNLSDFDVKPARTNVLLSMIGWILPVIIFIGFWLFLMNQVQGGGSKVMSFGKSRAKRMSVDSPKITFRDVAGVDEAVEELHEIKEFLENPKKFQALGARIPKGVLLYGPPGHRQDAARARRRRRGGRAVLLDLRLGLRRDVRRRRRLARARPVRAGQAELALHHLHGRDRRRRPPSRRRHGRRPRRARADAQPAARRDGRLRGQGQHHHDRGHQPARHPRSRPAAPRPLRPPDHRRPPRPQGPREDPRGPHARQAARARTSRSTRSPARRPASPAPTSPTSSTRPRCSPPARARRRSPRRSSKRASCASSPARRRRPG